jgi:hypothetical protein
MPKEEKPDKNKEPLFDHPKNDFQILEQVIIQSERAGFSGWQRDESAKETAEYLLFYDFFPEEIFYHDFAAAFFQCKNEADYLKHLQEMIVYKNPFEYLKKHLRPKKQIRKIKFDYTHYPEPGDQVSMHTPESDYEIMDKVAEKTKRAGYKWIQEEPGDTTEHLTYWLLRLRRFPFNIFTHAFAAAFFQCEKEEDNLKHLQEMAVYKNPFEYLEKFIQQTKGARHETLNFSQSKRFPIP